MAKACPVNNLVSVDGNFKVPQLRDVELTGPYFHNGGQATLKEVTEFYRRHGDFGNLNIAGLEDQMADINFSAAEGDLLVKFLLTLTDDRVKDQDAPFDHPQIFVPNGHPGDQNNIQANTSPLCINNTLVGHSMTTNGTQACDSPMMIPAVGREGRAAYGLLPLTAFLNVNQLDPGKLLP